MWDDLSEKVAEVHRSCVDDRVSNLSILEKLANIERRLSLLLQALESIPEDKLELMRKIKDSERRSRYVSVTTSQASSETDYNSTTALSHLYLVDK